MAKFFKKSTLSTDQQDRAEQNAAKVAGWITRGQRRWSLAMHHSIGSWSLTGQKVFFVFLFLSGFTGFGLIGYRAVFHQRQAVHIDPIRQPPSFGQWHQELGRDTLSYPNE